MTQESWFDFQQRLSEFSLTTKQAFRFSGNYSGRNVKLATHPHLLPKVTLRVTMPSRSHVMHEIMSP